MKLENITETDLIAILENVPELFRLKKYNDASFVRKHLALYIHRNGFYGTKNAIGELKFLNKSNTEFVSQEDVNIVIEGVVSLDKTPSITGGGSIIYEGYGLLESNGTVIYNGRATGNSSTDINNDSTLPGSSLTDALNNVNLEIEDLKDNVFKVNYYEIIEISSTTSGTLQETPQGGQIIEDQFGDSGNSVASTLTTANTPTYESPLDSNSDPITVNLDINGNWVSSANYSTPLAIIYSFTIEFSDWNNVNTGRIIDYYKISDGITEDDLDSKEDSFTKNTAFNKDFGTNAGEVLEGDTRTITPSEITKIANSLEVGDNISELTNDEGFETPSELNDRDTANRNRSNHIGTQLASTISDFDTEVSNNPSVVANTSKVSADDSVTTHSDVTSAGSGEIITTAERNNLSNQSNTNTGDETGSTIETKYEGLANTNKYTDAEKSKLAGLESSKYKGEYTSLTALQTAFPTADAGSYADVDGGLGQDVVRYIWDNNDSQWVLQLGESSALTDSQIKTQYENNPDTNAFTDAEKTKLSNQSGNNTGDETTSTIQSKRAIKTIVGESLEGTGNVEVIKSVVSLGGGTTLLKEIVSNIARFKTIEAQGGTFLETDGDKIIINSPIVSPSYTGKALTTFTGNINTVNPTIIPFTNLVINQGAKFSLGPNGGIILDEDSFVETFSHISFDETGNSQRAQVGTQIHIGGVAQGVTARNSYIRDSNGHVSDTSYLRESFPNVSAGVEITVRARKLASSNGILNVLPNDTYFEIKIKDKVEIDPPIITSPLSNSIITFQDGVVATYQVVVDGLVDTYSLTGNNSQFSIDANGLITYNGTGSVNGFSDTITVVNTGGQDDVNVTFDVIANPFTVTGYFAHYRAEDLSLTDGDSIPTLTDISGNGNDLTQNTITEQPLYNENLGSYKAIQFDGIDDRIFNNSLFIPSSTQCFFAVIKTNSSTLNRVVFNLFGVARRATMTINDTVLGNYGASFNDPNPNTLTTSVNVNDDSWHLLVARNLGTSSEIYFDGGSAVTLTAANVALNISQLNLGSLANGGRYYDGAIAEFIGYSQNITNAQLQNISNFLINKYGI